MLDLFPFKAVSRVDTSKEELYIGTMRVTPFMGMQVVFGDNK
jgi:hypothetical protein